MREREREREKDTSKEQEKNRTIAQTYFTFERKIQNSQLLSFYAFLPIPIYIIFGIALSVFVHVYSTKFFNNF
jgi:hypothetical protein